jgi:uncharacterized protein
MPVQMEVRRIIISEIVDSQQFVILKEVDGKRSFPIMIGIFEAHSIKRRVLDAKTPRPLAHDLVINCVEQLGGEIQDMIINDLVDGTYYAVLRIKKDGEIHEVDCRPSDAIPIAVSQKIPIWVNEEIFGEIEGDAQFAAGSGENADEDDDDDDDDDEDSELDNDDDDSI